MHVTAPYLMDPFGALELPDWPLNSQGGRHDWRLGRRAERPGPLVHGAPAPACCRIAPPIPSAALQLLSPSPFGFPEHSKTNMHLLISHAMHQCPVAGSAQQPRDARRRHGWPPSPVPRLTGAEDLHRNSCACARARTPFATNASWARRRRRGRPLPAPGAVCLRPSKLHRRQMRRICPRQRTDGRPRRCHMGEEKTARGAAPVAP